MKLGASWCVVADPRARRTRAALLRTVFVTVLRAPAAQGKNPLRESARSGLTVAFLDLDSDCGQAKLFRGAQRGSDAHVWVADERGLSGLLRDAGTQTEAYATSPARKDRDART